MTLLMLTGVFLMSFLPKHTIAQIKPMCLSQFALANQACAFLPKTEGHGDLNATQLQVAVDNDNDNDNDDGGGDGGGDDVNEHEHRHGRPGSGDGHSQTPGNGNGSDHSQRRGNGTDHRRGRGNGNGNGRRQSHGNGNGHRQRHEHGHGHGGDHRDEPRVNKDCCRWLEEVDVSCVCGVLHRLPPFLVKPDHQYSIKVGKTCSRAFHCYGV